MKDAECIQTHTDAIKVYLVVGRRRGMEGSAVSVLWSWLRNEASAPEFSPIDARVARFY